MTRGFPFYLAGAAVLGTLAALAGCGRGFFQFEQRAPWRHQAEEQCLKSGAVREDAGVVRLSPIEGPGVCGMDFPLKVSELNETSALGFADELRPPGAIPNAAPAAQPPWPVTAPRYAPAPATYAPPSAPRYNTPQNYPPQNYPPAASYNSPPQPYGAGAFPGEPLSLSPPGVSNSLDTNTIGRPSYTPPPSYPPDRPASNVPPSYPPTRPAYAPPAAPVPLGPARGPQFTAANVPVAVKPAATLACPIVSRLDQWIAESVQPAAMRWFGAPVTEIKQISSYSCRTMNGQPGAHISEHAFGNALDIAGFVLADGRKILVRTGWKGLPEEQGFLHDIQTSACEDFKTVLAPGANIFHYDHIHVDLMRRSGRPFICEPAAIPGDVAAARAAARYAHKADPGVTGSIKRALSAASAYEGGHAGPQDEENAFDN
jgi:hypothetical protein